MNVLQRRANPPKLHNVIPIDTRRGAGELGTYHVPLGPSHPPPPSVYTLERWLAGFSQPEKSVACGPPPSALWDAEIAKLTEESLPARASPASSHRMPPPKLPRTIQAAEADDDGWKRIVLDFHVGANHVVVRCQVCPHSGAVRNFRVDLLPLSS